ncbi:MAG: hypothetical protein ACLVAW_14000 [Eisenbergiella massiliensis]
MDQLTKKLLLIPGDTSLNARRMIGGYHNSMILTISLCLGQDWYRQAMNNFLDS